MDDCYACRRNGTPPGELPPRELVFDDGNWRVVHAFGSAIPGWLVVVCRRHLTSMSQLTPQEAAVLGPLLAALSAALETVFPARKAYVAFLAEVEGFEHLHIHVVPRDNDMPPERRSKRVFDWLGMHEGEAVNDEEADRIALELRPLVHNRMSRWVTKSTPEPGVYVLVCASVSPIRSRRHEARSTCQVPERL